MAGGPPNLDYLPNQRQGWHGGWNYQQASYPRGNKRQKGNPVVQRYAPPPGYIPPPNSAPPCSGQYPGFPAPASSPHGYNYAQQYPAPYPHPHAYGQTPLYHSGAIPQYSQYSQYPQQPQPNQYPISHPYHQPYPQQPHSAPVTHPPFPTQQQNVPTPEHKAQIDPQKQLSSKKEGRPPTDDYSYDIPCTWDEGGDGSGYGNDNALWPKSDDDVDKRFSLGLICIYPPKEVTRALMPTWELAEEQEKDNGLHRPALGNRDSVSEYYRHDNDYQAYLDVRQTDEWEEYQNDPIFKDLTGQGNWIPLQEAITLRERIESPSSSTSDGSHDRLWDEVEQWQRSVDAEESYSQSSHPPQDSMSDRNHDHYDDHYQFSSGHQEKVLARLGVEGPAKPESSQLCEDEEQVSPENHINTYSRRSTPFRSPSAEHRHATVGQNPQISHNEQRDNPKSLSRRNSNSSQHTIAGSDFANRTPSEANGTRPSSFKGTPPPPSPPQQHGRKRIYRDYDDEVASENAEMEYMRRKKLTASQARNPYARRW